MGRLYWLVRGLWTKADNGDWSFEEKPSEQHESLIINRTDSFEGLVERTRITLNLGILTPVVLTYQLPDWMLLPDAAATPPTTLLTDKDVETMTSVREYMSEAYLFVTSGPEPVAKYQFQRRFPFTIEGRTYLGEGVTEEQHKQDIKDLVGGHPIVCSKHMLEIMFNEPQLLTVFRVALEIEMVYAETEDGTDDFPGLTVDDVIDMGQGVTISPEDPYNYDPYDEVLYGEPMPLEELARVFPPTDPLSNGQHSINGENRTTADAPRNQQSLSLFNDGEDFSYEVYVHPAPPPPPPHAAIARPVGSNRRISAPPIAAIVVIEDDGDASYTGSSDGINDNDDIIIVSQSQPTLIIPQGGSLTDVQVGAMSGDGDKGNTEKSSEVPVLQTTLPSSISMEPSLDLTLAVGNVDAEKEPDSELVIPDSSSDAEDVTGGSGPVF
ncbi:hypothetical protein Bca52824_089978 [Brassica carinata]|uniref:Uncharacterized protein n=1 Tax=Brassica carinata TaxID=52824 RepID=A0A8X7NVG3_BRACI|nr:hypothetical protein Bca52824_089978 [Brassica carinata]